jgi:O-methyltransferase
MTGFLARLRRPGQRSPATQPAESSRSPVGTGDVDAALAVLRQAAEDPACAARIFDTVLEFLRPYHRSIFWGDRMLLLDRSVEFLDDPGFRRAISAASSATGINQYASPDGISWRYLTLIWAAHQALRVAGDFVECGVYEGDMSWVLTEMIDLAGAGRRLHLFDTFDGFSPKYSSEADFPDDPKFFDFADRDYKRPEIYEHVTARFAAKPYVAIHRGAVPETLTAAPGTIAFLHLDMNSPGPERAALDALYDRISPGGVIVFDDYGWALYRLQKQAADEFLAARGLSILQLPTGQGLAVKPG